MSTFTTSDLTFNGRELQSMSEAVFEDVFLKEDLNAIHDIVEGIKAKMQIGIAGVLGNVGKEAVTCPPTSDGTIPWTEKFWDPKDIEARLLQCWKDLLPSFHAWGLKNGCEIANLDGTDYWNFVEERMSDAVEEAIWRIAWFGDTAEDNVASLGNITDGVDAAYYTMLDGFWPQLIDIATTTPARRAIISENAGISYTAQALADDAALAIFTEMKYGADLRLRGKADLFILCTQSMYDNYAHSLRGTTATSGDMAFARIENGFNTLSFEGIPVIPLNIWDRKIQADFDTTVVHHIPHRAVLTYKDNLKIGVGSAGALDEVTTNYDAKSKETFSDACWKMDAKVILDYDVQVAY
jgi:hypothetical protein